MYDVHCIVCYNYYSSVIGTDKTVSTEYLRDFRLVGWSVYRHRVDENEFHLFRDIVS